MGAIVKATTDIQKNIGGLILFVAHTGKDQTKEIRGHSSLLAALDAAIKVKNTYGRVWEMNKAKEAEDGSTYCFRLHSVELGTDEDGEPVTSCVVIPSGVQQSKEKSTHLTEANQYALKTFKKACEAKGKEGLLDGEWRECFYEEYQGNAEAKKKAFQRAKDKLVELGLLVVENNVYKMRDAGQTTGTGRDTPL